MSRHRATPPWQRGLLGASAVMAAGTIVSRATGFARSAMVIVALGLGVDADLYTVSNTIPTAMYILVAGGIFNVVLVPQLVRATRNDADGGEAYAQRIVTLGLLVLGVATVALVVATPLLARVIFNGQYFTPELTAERESAYALMRYCLPQVFFYGAFVLAGQILNARERFGPMMWAPIVNNVVSVLILGAFIAYYGPARGDAAGGFSTAAEVWLGIGSTIGIALQAAVLVPYLRRAGFRFRPRFDFRGVGLSHTLRLGLWTLGFVVLNQISFVVINRIASGASAQAAREGSDPTGATVYQLAFLISQVPHGIITVSVLTATIPLLSRLSADHDYPRVVEELQGAMRVVLAAIVPIAVAVACLGHLTATVLVSWGDLGTGAGTVGDAIVAFAPAMVFFSVHYMVLRGFYSDEDTRTPFLVQVWLTVANVVLAYTLTSIAPNAQVAVFLALAYGGAYLVGSTVGSTLLSRRVGRIFDAATVGYLLRLAAAAGTCGLAMLATSAVGRSLGADTATVGGALPVLAVAGLVGVVTYLLGARLLALAEVTALLRVVSRRR